MNLIEPHYKAKIRFYNNFLDNLEESSIGLKTVNIFSNIPRNNLDKLSLVEMARTFFDLWDP